MRPLPRLTQKDTPWKWEDKAQGAFGALQVAMTSERILKHFTATKEITIDIDVSDYAIGAVGSQLDDANVLYPVRHYSRKLKSAELNSDVHDKDLLAIAEALREWDTCCRSTPYIIHILSDNKNLEYWKTKRD
jgi:hypothetical protein